MGISRFCALNAISGVQTSFNVKHLPEVFCLIFTCVLFRLGYGSYMRSLMNDWCPQETTSGVLCFGHQRFSAWERKRCALWWLLVWDTGRKHSSFFKGKDPKLRWQDQTWPSWSDDGGVGSVSGRNNLTLLEHFTSNTQPEQQQECFISLLCTCVQSSAIKLSLPLPTSPHTHHRLSSPLGATKRLVNCVCFVGIYSMKCTWCRAGRNIQLSPAFSTLGSEAVLRHDIMRQTDACNRQPPMTAFHRSHHYKCLSHYLSFGLLQLSFHEFKLSVRATAHTGRLRSTRLNGVKWCEVEVLCHREAETWRDLSQVKCFPSQSSSEVSVRAYRCQTIIRLPSAFSIPALSSQPDQCDDSYQLTVFTRT